MIAIVFHTRVKRKVSKSKVDIEKSGMSEVLLYFKLTISFPRESAIDCGHRPFEVLPSSIKLHEMQSSLMMVASVHDSAPLYSAFVCSHDILMSQGLAFEAAQHNTQHSFWIPPTVQRLQTMCHWLYLRQHDQNLSHWPHWKSRQTLELQPLSDIQRCCMKYTRERRPPDIGFLLSYQQRLRVENIHALGMWF